MPQFGRAMVLLAVLATSVAFARPATPAGWFAKRVIRNAGAARTKCFCSIRRLEESMRERDPASDFRTLCAKVPRETSDLRHLSEAVLTAVRDLREEGLTPEMQEDWVEHYTFGQSFSVKYGVEGESIIIWWHPATRLIEIRIWKPASVAAEDAGPP